jgi:hypothetical protein
MGEPREPDRGRDHAAKREMTPEDGSLPHDFDRDCPDSQATK